MNTSSTFNNKAVFDEIVDAVIITDGLTRKILDVNKACCSVLGYNKEELINNNLFNFFDEELISNIPKKPDQITMYGSVLSNRKIKNKSGKLIPVDMTINTFSGDNGNYVMTSLRDVSERIKYENEIIEMNKELSRSNATKDKLFSIIAHDLRNPMMALMGFSEILSGGTEESISAEETSELSGMIKELSQNTYELLENLLNWAQVQTKKIEMEKKEFDLFKLVEKIMNILKPSASLKKINLINNVTPAFKIYADENMINTIIRNLISNSIKFSNKDSNVTIKAADENENWNISVKDEGIGMDEDYVADLFKVDMHNSRYGTNKEKGTGLGLVLCYDFAKLHNGNILVFSEVGKGSEFIVQLSKKN